MTEEFNFSKQPDLMHNMPELSVSEISNALKKTVESSFSRVRVKGEISGFKRAASGHLYMSLKDDKSVLSAICWKGVASKLLTKPEDGIEVVCTGKLTTYAGRSSYQIIIEQMELAGQGALLKLLEQRKQKLSKEGLFDDIHKKKIPFLPEVIGGVTSPTGAVIRDIMHRIIGRFERQVLLYPSQVQGENAAKTIIKAINDINNIPEDGIIAHDGKNINKPDVIIIARGGGSLEDLWCFNDEDLIRAVFKSKIPIISAVGHETDTMLIDYVADLRAPTPTGAAEMAVPVKLDIMSGLNQSQIRLNNAVKRFFQEYDIRIESAKRAIPNLNNIIFEYTQKLDDRCERFINSFENYIKHQNSRVLQLSLNLKSPNQLLSDSSLLFKNLFSKLEKLWIKKIYDKTNNLTLITSRLNINNFKKEINNNDDKMENVFSRFNLSYSRQIDKKQEKLKNLELRLENCSFQKTIKRGFAIIKDEKGNVITSKSKAKAKEEIDILFNDGVLKTFTKKITKTVRKKSKPKLKDENQGSLF